MLEASELPAGWRRPSTKPMPRCAKRGLPTRRVEAWHYTDLRTRSRPSRRLRESGFATTLNHFLKLARSSRRPESHSSMARGSIRTSLPEGISIGEALVSARLSAAMPTPSAFSTRCSPQHGVAVKSSKRAPMPVPLELIHTITAARSVALRHAVAVGKGAKAVMLERHVGEAWRWPRIRTPSRRSKSPTAPRSLWLIVQEQGDAAIHLAQLNVELGADAKLTILVMNAGGKLVRREINILAKGENSHDRHSRRQPARRQHPYRRHHGARSMKRRASARRNCSATWRRARGAASSRARSRSHQIAQKTDAKMACNTLLLSDDGGVLRQAGAGDLRRRRRLRPWRDRHRDRRRPSVLPDGARHSGKAGARHAGEGLRRGGDRRTGRRDDARGARGPHRRLAAAHMGESHAPLPTTSSHPPRFPDPVAGGLWQAAGLSRQRRLGAEAAGRDRRHGPARMENEYANVHRGLHFLSNAATDAYEKARETVRAFPQCAARRRDRSSPRARRRRSTSSPMAGHAQSAARATRSCCR